MKRVQAYKYELIPNGEQKRNMRRFAGSCRYVYNKALAVKKEAYEKEGKTIGYYGPEGTAKLLTKWKKDPETQWLAESPSQVLHQLHILRIACILRSLPGDRPGDQSMIPQMGVGIKDAIGYKARQLALKEFDVFGSQQSGLIYLQSGHTL